MSFAVLVACRSSYSIFTYIIFLDPHENYVSWKEKKYLMNIYTDLKNLYYLISFLY